MKRPYVLALATLMGSSAQAVCVPSKLYTKTFLGFSPDEATYAVGLSDEVLWWSQKRPDDWNNRICFFSSQDNLPTGRCVSIDVPRQAMHPEPARKAFREAFAREYPEWKLSKLPKPDLVATLNCEKVVNDEGEEAAECPIEFKRRSAPGELIPSFTYAFKAHRSPSPRVFKAEESYLSPSGRVACYKFETVRHSSANCNSLEDVLHCMNVPPREVVYRIELKDWPEEIQKQIAEELQRSVVQGGQCWDLYQNTCHHFTVGGEMGQSGRALRLTYKPSGRVQVEIFRPNGVKPLRIRNTTLKVPTEGWGEAVRQWVQK